MNVIVFGTEEKLGLEFGIRFRDRIMIDIINSIRIGITILT